MSEIRILGVLVEDRSQAAVRVQEVLTKYGCTVKTRLGIHELDVPGWDASGLIILELTGSADECLRLENELWNIDRVKLQKMVF